MRIPLSSPDITDAEVLAVVRALRSGRLSRGPELLRFEALCAQRACTPHGVAVSSGTAALHLAMRACGIGDGDEVITTPFSFIASANAILYERARPVFVDIDPHTWNIDVNRIEEAIGPRTRAILPVHLFGLPVEMRALLDIAARHQLVVIEDACEALGAEYGARPVGGMGTCGVFGFYANKQITAAEGGALVTRDAGLAEKCRMLRNHGRPDAAASAGIEELGYNYRLSELHAALGSAQLERFDELSRARERVARWYDSRLGQQPLVSVPVAPSSGSRRSWFVYVITLAPGITAGQRDRIVAELARQGIGCGTYFPPIHLQPHIAALGHRPGEFPVTEAIAARTLALPFSSCIDEASVDDVVSSLNRLLAAVTQAGVT